MRAILIDPWNRAVTEIERGPKYDDLLAALTCPQHTVECVAALGIAPGETLWLDDEGLLVPGVPLWRFRSYPTPLAGRGVISGVGPEGEDRPSALDADRVRRAVAWTDAETSGDLTPGYTSHAAAADPDDPLAALVGGFTVHGGSVIPQPAGTAAKAKAEGEG